MGYEQSIFESKYESASEAKVETGYEQFAPPEFKADPIGYFEKEGKNIKSGKTKYDEDPTAVKILPDWTDREGNRIKVVGKRVNIKKGEIAKSGDPFYEYKILELVNELGLPASKPIAKVEQENKHLIVMEEIEGIKWSEKKALRLKEKGYSDEDVENLKRQAEEQMKELRKRFEEAGIIRGWKLKDMIFDIDIENKKIRKIVPTDWERTNVDRQKVEEYKKMLISRGII